MITSIQAIGVAQIGDIEGRAASTQPSAAKLDQALLKQAQVTGAASHTALQSQVQAKKDQDLRQTAKLLGHPGVGPLAAVDALEPAVANHQDGDEDEPGSHKRGALKPRKKIKPPPPANGF